MQTVTVTRFTKAERTNLIARQETAVAWWLGIAQYFENLRQPAFPTLGIEGTDARGLKVLTKKITRYQNEAALVANMKLPELVEYLARKDAEMDASGKVTPDTPVIQ